MTANLKPVPDPAAPATPEPIALPNWLDEAKRWHQATVRLAEALAREDAGMTAEIKQVRGLRKLIDAVLERVEPAGGSDS